MMNTQIICYEETKPYLNRLWIAVSSLVVMALLFSYYFFVYVPDQEEQVVAKKYRALKRIGQNFIHFKSDLQNSINQELGDFDQAYDNCSKNCSNLNKRNSELP